MLSDHLTAVLLHKTRLYVHMIIVIVYCSWINYIYIYILSGMEGCPSHLSFNMGVTCSITAIICLMYSLIFGRGVPVVPSSWWPNNTSQAVVQQSLCLLSQNAHINSSKAGVQVQSLPIWLWNIGIMYSSLWPGIPEMNSRTWLPWCHEHQLSFDF